MNNWHFLKSLKTKLLSAICLTSCCFMLHASNVDAKEATNVTTDVMISYKNDTGKTFILNNISKVDTVLNKVEIIRASITNKQYHTLINNQNVEFINKSTEKIAVTNTIQTNGPIQIPSFTSYWNLDYVKAPSYWKKGYLGIGVKVAVIDTGINKIPDLKNVVQRVSFVKDNPNTPKVDESDLWDRGNFGDGHGTSVAAVIGAQIGETTFKKSISDIIGVAPNVQIYSLKYADGTKDGTIAEVIEAINWSIKHKMEIINISSSIYENNKSLKKAIDKAVKAGIIIVAAAGNDGNSDEPTYPARYHNVIGVSSIGKNKKISTFSNTGTTVDFAAPGDYVPTLNRKGEFFYATGTSYAAPHVTGLLALLKEKYPFSSSTELIHKLRASALDLGAKGKDSKYGYGLAQIPKLSNVKPKDLEDVKVSTIKDHKATISYTLPKDKSFKKVILILNGTKKFYTTKTSHTFTNLQSSKTYKVQLKAIYNNGDSSEGLEQTFKTQKDITAPSEIDKLRISNLKIDSVKLSWLNPTDHDFDETKIFLNDQLLDSTASETFTVKNLKANSDYQFTFVTKDTSGNHSKKISAKIHTPKKLEVPTPQVKTVKTSSKTITGKTKPNMEIKVRHGKTIVAKELADQKGHFKINIPFQSVDTILTITAEDVTGNRSKPKQLKVKQSKTPAQPIVKPVSSNTLYLRGEAERDAIVSVYRGTTLLASKHVDSKGHFSLYINKQRKKSILNVYVTNKHGIKSKAFKVIVQ